MSEFIDYVFQRSTSLNKIDNSLYSKYNVKNGLRNEDGTGVLVGLTRISDVVGYKKENGKKIDTEGELYYRGVKVSDFIKGHDAKNRFLFEEVCFLILFLAASARLFSPSPCQTGHCHSIRCANHSKCSHGNNHDINSYCNLRQTTIGRFSSGLTASWR